MKFREMAEASIFTQLYDLRLIKGRFPTTGNSSEGLDQAMERQSLSMQSFPTYDRKSVMDIYGEFYLTHILTWVYVIQNLSPSS